MNQTLQTLIMLAKKHTGDSTDRIAGAYSPRLHGQSYTELLDILMNVGGYNASETDADMTTAAILSVAVMNGSIDRTVVDDYSPTIQQLVDEVRCYTIAPDKDVTHEVIEGISAMSLAARTILLAKLIVAVEAFSRPPETTLHDDEVTVMCIMAREIVHRAIISRDDNDGVIVDDANMEMVDYFEKAVRGSYTRGGATKPLLPASCIVDYESVEIPEIEGVEFDSPPTAD